jgi:hypothetical protein
MCRLAVRNNSSGVQGQAMSASMPCAARTAAPIWSTPLQPALSLPTSGLAMHSDLVQDCVPAAPACTPQGHTAVVLTKSELVEPAKKIGPLLDTLEGGKTWYLNGSINPM